jgi:hypothetical protein
MSKNLGVALVFGGLVLLGIWRVLIVTQLSGGLKVFSFLIGISLCVLGMVIVRRNRKS